MSNSHTCWRRGYSITRSSHIQLELEGKLRLTLALVRMMGNSDRGHAQDSRDTLAGSPQLWAGLPQSGFKGQSNIMILHQTIIDGTLFQKFLHFGTSVQTLACSASTKLMRGPGLSNLLTIPVLNSISRHPVITFYGYSARKETRLWSGSSALIDISGPGLTSTSICTRAQHPGFSAKSWGFEEALIHHRAAGRMHARIPPILQLRLRGVSGFDKAETSIKVQSHHDCINQCL